MSPKASTNLRLSVMKLLAGPDEVARSIANDFADAGQWTQAIRLCGTWKLLPALEARIGVLDLALPTDDRSNLARLTMYAFMNSSLAIRSACPALAALEQAGIRCAGFKGIAAIAYLYNGARGRTLRDVDILIEPHTLTATLQILESLGYRRSFPGDLNEYLEFARNTPGAAGNEAMSLTDPEGAAIDLHWRLGTIGISDLLADIRYATVQKKEVPLLSPAHSLLLCVHHALRDDFVPDDIARDVLDFSKWRAYLDLQEDGPDLNAAIDRWGLRQSYLALDIISSHLREVPNSQSPMEGTASDRQAARHIADLYLHQLQFGPLNTDLTYVASHRPWLQIASGLATGWHSYRSHMRRSESLNGEASLTLTARALRFLRSAASVSPTRWLQLRALARAKDQLAAARSTSDGSLTHQAK